MPRGWPPLELREVLAILTALGLSYSHSKGGHDFYKGTRNGKPCTVTVDPKNAPFSVDLLQSMCKQAGSNRKEFYSATKATAAKVR
jgi:predicted RNA binding protein YcfA (HicA-like mRNA interferase family)